MAELEINADRDKLGQVFDFILNELSVRTDDRRLIREVKLCVEEIFLNIAGYAYHPDKGNVRIVTRVEGNKDPLRLFIVFMDQGRPFDPLAEATPDTESELEERRIGGLGIYLVKNIVDGITYEYTNGNNVLTIMKEIPIY